jgi:hypothetical protein
MLRALHAAYPDFTGTQKASGGPTAQIDFDSTGYLHMIAGARGQPLQYRRSLVSLTAHAGWSQLEQVGTTRACALVSGGPDRLWLAGGGETIIFTTEGALANPVSGQAPIRLPRPGSLTLADLTD